MTKEELKQDAIQFTNYYSTVFHVDDFLIYEAFLKVAEPREKRIAELEKENAQLRESFHDYREQVKNDNESIKEWKEKALKIMRDISACELMKVITKAKQYEALDNLENFLREIPEDSEC